MEDRTMSQLPPQTTNEYEAAIEECLAQMKRLQEQIDKDQVEIDRLKVETRAILAQMKAA